MMASRVVVTGAGGRIGGGIAARLAASGRLLAGIDRVEGEHVSHVMDLATPTPTLETDLLHAFDGADAVVHVAAHPGPSAAPPPGVDLAAAASAASAIGLEDVDPVRLASENFSSTMRVFDVAARVRAARVVFSSTAFTAGWCHKSTQRRPATLPMAEEDVAPHESYALSKICCEHAAAMYAAATEQQTTFVSLRFTNIVKREKLHELPWSYSDWSAPVTTQMADGDPVPPPLPLAFWAWTHEDDVLDAHIAALEDLDEWSEAMADGELLGVRGAASFLLAAPSTRFAESTAQVLEMHYGVTDAAKIAHNLEGNESVLDATRARRALSFSPRCWTNGFAQQ